MKRLMAAAAALSLMAGTNALADPPHDHAGSPPAGGAHAGGAGGGGGGNHSGGAGAGAGHGAGGVGGHPGGGAPAGGAPAGVGAGGASGGPHAYVPAGRNDTPHPEGGVAAAVQAVTHQGRPGFGAPGSAPGRDRPRYDPQHFPRQVRAHQHYDWHGSRGWRDQPGFYYQRWAYGQFLPTGWFTQDYWIDDYEDYDLPVPPYGYEWVRSGPDALLVDTYTGEVVEAVYGLF
jgi:Ni/Co efflux regulator RcnB